MHNTVHSRTARDTIMNSSGLIQIELLRTTRALLKDAIRKDASEIEHIKQELALLEQSRLHIHHNNQKYCFCAKPTGPGGEVGITGDMERVHKLARRAYLQERLKLIELNSYRLRKILSSCKEVEYEDRIRRKFSRYSEAGLDLSHIIFTEEQNEWIDEPYSPNPYHKESLKYRTGGGIPVRSMSEAKLGSFLESVGLPYRSDDIVEIRTEFGDHPFRDSYFADFKVPNLYGGITIHEHLGAMHIDDYPDNSLKRLNDYHNYTVFELPGRQVKHEEFTWSFGFELINEEMIRKVLHRMLLP